MSQKKTNEKMYYFGYGSNLDKEDWTKWCLQRGYRPEGLKEIGPAWIDGYYLDFDYFSKSRGAGAANLRYLFPGRAATPGALFEIDENTRNALDAKEGHPNPKYYRRIKTTAYTSNGESVEAYTYIHSAKQTEFHQPTAEYENFIRNGLNRLELPTTWLDAGLRKTPRPKFDLVFVYGTLMQEMSRHESMKENNFVCEATVNGELYNLGDYPGLISGNSTIHGELYKAMDIQVTLENLDRIECIDGDYPLFRRVIQQVNTNEGKVWAYVYHYARSTESLEKIDSGNWKRFLN